MASPEFVEVRNRRIATVRRVPEAQHVVVMCHGLHSNLAADHLPAMEQRLATIGIGTLRFDQYGNGRSDGTALERRFSDWVNLILELTHRLQAEGHQVSVLGNSMGGSAALAAASIEQTLFRCVAWVPGLGTAPQRKPGERHFVERGERMEWEFWRQYQSADVLGRLRRTEVPTLVLLATDDEYEDRQARVMAPAGHGTAVVELLEGYAHMDWTEAQAAAVVERTAIFLAS